MSRVISILDYIPPVLADTEEQKQISKALNPEINMLWAEIERAQNNQFISSSDEYGVAHRENMLSIKPKNTETLDDRKFRLLSREIEKLPYTYRVLKNKLKGQLEKYCRKYENERLVLDEIVSIYKPYWICKYNGKKIFLDA